MANQKEGQAAFVTNQPKAKCTCGKCSPKARLAALMERDMAEWRRTHPELVSMIEANAEREVAALRQLARNPPKPWFGGVGSVFAAGGPSEFDRS